MFAFLSPLIKNETENLADYNECAIRAVCAALGITQTRLVRASELNAEGEATDLLIDLVQKVGGTTYLCGGGAGGYQEDSKFAAAGVRLVYQNYRHPVYVQAATADFMPGLSVIDPLMNCGFQETSRWLRSG